MIRVQLPGRFRMYDETRCLNEEAIHSPMITKLLVYMICNKNHIVTLEQLTEALWTDEKSENPYGALKNMMYRLRGTLRKVWPVKRGSCLLYEGCHGTDEKPGAPQTAKEKYRFSRTLISRKPTRCGTTSRTLPSASFSVMTRW